MGNDPSSPLGESESKAIGGVQVDDLSGRHKRESQTKLQRDREEWTESRKRRRTDNEPLTHLMLYRRLTKIMMEFQNLKKEVRHEDAKTPSWMIDESVKLLNVIRSLEKQVNDYQTDTTNVTERMWLDYIQFQFHYYESDLKWISEGIPRMTRDEESQMDALHLRANALYWRLAEFAKTAADVLEYKALRARLNEIGPYNGMSDIIETMDSMKERFEG